MTREERIKELEKELFILKHTKECAFCGREFLSEYQNKRYCSESCYKKAYRKRGYSLNNDEKVDDFANKIETLERKNMKEIMNISYTMKIA